MRSTEVSFMDSLRCVIMCGQVVVSSDKFSGVIVKLSSMWNAIFLRDTLL